MLPIHRPLQVIRPCTSCDINIRDFHVQTLMKSFFIQTQLLQTNRFPVLKKSAPKIVALIFWIAIITVFHHYRIENNLSYRDMLWQGLYFFTDTMYGPLVYMALYAIRPILLFPATLLTALSGALFGFWWGVFYTVLGENISANLAYWIGRFFGTGIRLEDTIIGNWVEALRKNTFAAVLLLRLFYAPFDLTNYASGMLHVRWSQYTLATLIGIMPGLTTFVALGAAIDMDTLQTRGLSLAVFDSKLLILSAVIFVSSLTLSKLLHRWNEKRRAGL